MPAQEGESGMKFVDTSLGISSSIRLTASALALSLGLVVAHANDKSGAVIAQPASTATAAALPQVDKLLTSARQSLSAGNVGEVHDLIDQALDLLSKSSGDRSLQQASCYEILGQAQISEGLLGLAQDSLKKS